jgi:predicted nucleotidyltransferase
MSTQRINPVEAARRIRRERYAGARVLLLAGSVMRGEDTPTSDLDIVVVFEQLPHAYREAFVFEGWPVEAFVHDPETMNHYFESDRRLGLPALVRMVLEGVEIPKAGPFSAGLKRLASEVFEAGPPRSRETHRPNTASPSTPGRKCRGRTDRTHLAPRLC